MKLTWPHVAIVGMVLTTITILSLKDQDTTAILGLATLLFVGIGLIVGGQQAQRDQTNGTMSQMLMIMEGMAKQLAEMVPPKVVEDIEELEKEKSDAVRYSQER